MLNIQSSAEASKTQPARVPIANFALRLQGQASNLLALAVRSFGYVGVVGDTDYWKWKTRPFVSRVRNTGFPAASDDSKSRGLS